MSEIDPNTGLPELPNGYYYRIVRWSGATYDVEVKLKYKWLGFIPITKKQNLAYLPGRSPWGFGIGTIPVVAQELRDRVFTKPTRDQTYRAKLDAVVGNYPPKKWEN